MDHLPTKSKAMHVYDKTGNKDFVKEALESIIEQK